MTRSQYLSDNFSPAYPEPTIRLAKPDLGDEEIEAVSRVLRSSVLTNGPETAKFEAAFAAYHEVEHGIAFANGTLALMAIYAALGIGPGDEVIVPSLTFVSSATSISLVGATPVFADIDPRTFNLSPESVRKKLTSRTKAILAVHYGGQAADLEPLRDVAKSSGAVLLEDAAEAHGARYRGKPVGGWGKAAMFSFTPTKNITTGEGGMVTTDDGDLARQLRLLRNHGQTALYKHDLMGWNMRITEMQAAIGICQLAKLGAILERKRQVAQHLDKHLVGLKGISPPHVEADRDHVYMLYTTKAEQRDEVLHHLRQDGIEAKIYFPPVHQQPIYSAYSEADLPVTNEVSRKILSLPVHSWLGATDLGRIVDSLTLALSS